MKPDDVLFFFMFYYPVSFAFTFGVCLDEMRGFKEVCVGDVVKDLFLSCLLCWAFFPFGILYIALPWIDSVMKIKLKGGDDE